MITDLIGLHSVLLPLLTEIFFSLPRIVMMPGNRKAAIHSVDKKTISEGEMWGVNIRDFTEWVEENRDLNIKFLIYYVSL